MPIHHAFGYGSGCGLQCQLDNPYPGAFCNVSVSICVALSQHRDN